MPSPNQITLQLVDIDNIIAAIAISKPSGGIVTLIDNDPLITIRDKDGFLINSVPKTSTHEDN
jgi:hypothetical protein